MAKSSIKRRVAFALVGLTLNIGTSTATAEVVPVVSAKSAITSLSKDQIVNIFLDNRGRFPDGSPALPIDQLEGSTERNEFYELYANRSAAQIKAHWSKIIFTGRGLPPKEAASSADVIKRIAQNPNAIGYIEKSLVTDSVKVVSVR
jgi:ABC-type phosphate transport system substrate-binding protein